MSATDLEIDSYTIEVVSGTNQSDIPLATVNGALKEINIRRRQSKRNTSVYDIVIVHDDVGTTALEYTTRSVSVTSGTTITDQVYATVAGLAQASKAIATHSERGITTYEIIVVHLNA